MARLLKISPFAAVVGSITISFFFVASLYLWKLLGYTDPNRDEPGTIQRRCLSAFATCGLSALLVVGLSTQAPEGSQGAETVLELYGVRHGEMFSSCVACLGLTMILFLGPLVQSAYGFIFTHGIGFSCLLDAVKAEVSSSFSTRSRFWISMRNYVIAPISEEFVFRVCVVRLAVAASLPKGIIIFCTPFCFGLAHAHHFFEHVRKSGDKARASAQVAFQVFYTCLFGSYCNFLLLRTGQVIALILTHTFCNYQGFPDFSFLVSQSHPLYSQRLWLGGLYVVGVFGFFMMLFPMTNGFSLPPSF